MMRSFRQQAIPKKSRRKNESTIKKQDQDSFRKQLIGAQPKIQKQTVEHRTIRYGHESIRHSIHLSISTEETDPTPNIANEETKNLRCTNRFQEECELEDVHAHKILGVGAYGKVWLVSDKSTNKSFALKVLSKKSIIKNKQLDLVLREKSIISSIDHPFVLCMDSCCQDTKHLYFKLPVMKGGDLFSRIHTKISNGLPKTSAAFYSACVLEALYYLHGCNIAHRDLKPENVLIDETGYCCITDFGFARMIAEGEKCATTCGTQEYMSPELIMGKGHNWSVDCWAFGVMLHEMLVGKTPFYSKSPVKMMKKVITLQAKYPKNMDEDGRDLVQSLLKTDPDERSDHDMKIKQHKFYKSINWDALVKKEIQAPWVPRSNVEPVESVLLEKQFSGRRFESESECESVLCESNQRLFKDFY